MPAEAVAHNLCVLIQSFYELCIESDLRDLMGSPDAVA